MDQREFDPLIPEEALGLRPRTVDATGKGNASALYIEFRDPEFDPTAHEARERRILRILQEKDSDGGFTQPLENGVTKEVTVQGKSGTVTSGQIPDSDVPAVQVELQTSFGVVVIVGLNIPEDEMMEVAESMRPARQ